MNRDRLRTSGSARGPHTLVPVTPESPRRPLRTFLLATLAVSIGVVVGLVWLAQQGRGSLETLPDQTALLTATTTATATALPSETSTTVVLAAQSGAGVAAVKPLIVETPTPTPTSTPRPPLASVAGVVGIGGASRYDESGLLLDELPQGAEVTVTARDADGGWLLAQTPDGQSGWTTADSLIVFDAGRLAVQAVVIIPITPTPVALSDDGTTVAPQATPLPDDALTARVDLESGRLNLRAGPGPTYMVIAKAQAGATLALLGRNADSTWLQVAAPELPGGFAWAAAEYLAVTGDAQTLPVVAAVSDAPPYRNDSDTAPTQGMVPGPATVGRDIQPRRR